MRGSLRGGASQTQQTSSTPAATEENRERQGRGAEGGEAGNVKEEDRDGERTREQSTALIYVY